MSLARHNIYIYLILKKYATLPTITFYDMNAMGIGQMVLYLGINISAFTLQPLCLKVIPLYQYV